MNSRPGRLGVGVIGAGRVGAVLANALRSAGHAVVGVSANSTQSRDRVDALLPGVPVLSVEEVLERSELVLFTVPDDVLADLVSGLASLDRFISGQLVVHTAGRYGTDVLAPARAKGAIPLAIHPAMTFTGTSVDLGRLIGAPFAVTAPGPVLPIAQALVVEIGGEPVSMQESARPLYHAALAHGANHLVTLTAQARRVLESTGVEDPGTLLRPLLTAALDGALRAGDSALTGPIARGDAGTVAEHLATLAALESGQDVLDVLPSYVAMARATVQRSLSTGRIRAEQARAVLDELNGGSIEGEGIAGPVDAVESGAAGEPDGGAAGEPDGRAGESIADDAAREGIVLAHTIDELQAHLSEHGHDRRRAVVMTMGSLHEGHLSLIRKAAELADHITVTIFVNPLQFDQESDLAAYPRSLESDLAALDEVGVVDLVFAPATSQMYPDGAPQVSVRAGELAERLEGAHRPGHFDGMLTVVHKLLNLTRPHVALFGQKDAQQLNLVRQMASDLNMGCEIVAAPTVREPDGLAMSSRNALLSADEREQALALVRALRAGRTAAAAGQAPAQVLAAAQAEFDAVEANGVELDYLQLVQPGSMTRYRPDSGGAGLLVVAARVGTVRLIDNMAVAWP